MKQKPAGYQSQSDLILNQLRSVGQTEMKRMNLSGRRGKVRFQKEGDFQGKYYKEVKVYESFQPLDTRPYTAGASEERGYYGYISYTYRVYESERTPNRVDAQAKTADIRTDQTGHETYRYKFGPGGAWDGRQGELTHR